VELGEKQGGDEDGKRMDGAVLYGLFLFWVFFVALFTPATTKEMDGWCHDGAHTSSWARGVNFLASVSSCAIRLCPYVGWVVPSREHRTAGKKKVKQPGPFIPKPLESAFATNFRGEERKIVHSACCRNQKCLHLRGHVVIV
jgi:hypothetical protein